jgi:predicted O-methyltransferase YrrM
MIIDKFKSAVSTALECTQILAVDWMNGRRRPYWNAARWQLRTLRFRAHCGLPAISLAQVCDEISSTDAGPVTLPSSTIPTEGVGSPEYYFAIGAIARSLQPRTVVEFGTYVGLGAATLALNAPSATIYTLDLPDDASSTSQESLDATDRELVQRSRYRVGEAFLSLEIANRIKQVRIDSAKLKLTDIVTEADLVLIDGGHSSSVVRADTENALAVLSGRGIILWDDYWWLYPELVRYLELKAKHLPLKRIEGTNLVFYRR